MLDAHSEGARRRNPVKVCPVCGRAVACNVLPAHVGGERCVLQLHQLRGAFHDATRGPAALAAATALADALRAPEVTP